MIATLITAPANFPVSLAEVKAHLRIESTFTDDDGYLQSLVMAATEAVESILRRKLITQTYKYFLSDWPREDFIVLPYGKLQSVTSVKYLDSDATENTMDSGEYIVDTDSDPGRIVLDYGESWPSETLLTSNPIYIEFVCGYGSHTAVTVTNATNATPIVVTATSHGMVSNDKAVVASVGGNTNANGQWVVTKVTDDTLSLNGSSGNAVYTSGGTITEVTVPEPIRQAVKMLVSEYYENREQTVIGQSVGEIPNYIVNLLWPYRIMVV